MGCKGRFIVVARGCLRGGFIFTYGRLFLLFLFLALLRFFCVRVGVVVYGKMEEGREEAYL